MQIEIRSEGVLWFLCRGQRSNLDCQVSLPSAHLLLAAPSQKEGSIHIICKFCLRENLPNNATTEWLEMFSFVTRIIFVISVKIDIMPCNYIVLQQPHLGAHVPAEGIHV